MVVHGVTPMYWVVQPTVIEDLYHLASNSATVIDIQLANIGGVNKKGFTRYF